MELNIIVHGRSASTLLARMLLGTGVFVLWGDIRFACELKSFKEPRSWRSDRIDNDLKSFEGNRVLAKLPEFQYFLELLFPYKARVLVNERSALEKLRSLMSVPGWCERACNKYEERGLVKKAFSDYRANGGSDFPEVTFLEKAFLVLVWGNWRVREKLDLYSGDSLFLSFDELMLRPHDAYVRLDLFYGFEPRKFWDKWDNQRKKRYQISGRDITNLSAFSSPYQISFNPEQLELFSKILKAFR